MIESARAWLHVQWAFWMRKYQILVWKLECLSFCVWLSLCEYKIKKEINTTWPNQTWSSFWNAVRISSSLLLSFMCAFISKAYHHRSINEQLIRDWSQVGDVNEFGDRYAIVYVRQANKKWLWSAKSKNGTFHRKTVSIEN